MDSNDKRQRDDESRNQDIKKRVIAVIADVLECEPEEVDASASLENLGMDSLDAVQLVMELEDEFDITIEDDAAEDVRTVADIISYIASADPE